MIRLPRGGSRRPRVRTIPASGLVRATIPQRRCSPFGETGFDLVVRNGGAWVVQRRQDLGPEPGVMGRRIGREAARQAGRFRAGIRPPNAGQARTFAVSSIPRVFITASVVFRVGFPFSLNDR